MKNILYLMLPILFIGASCSPQALNYPHDESACEAACTRLKVLKCREGEDLPDSDGQMVSCVEWCEYSVGTLHIDLRPSCVANITECSAIESQCSSGKDRK